MQVLHDYLKSLEKKNDSKRQLNRFIFTDGRWLKDTIQPRSAETLFTRDNVWQELLTDAQDFLNESTRTFYALHGIPYVRNYLFYGPPGNGKSACIRTLASACNLNLYSLNLSTAQMDDSSLISLIHSVAKQSIVAMEDIDRIFDHFSANQSSSSISFAALLNVLDGLLAKEGIIFVLTCNKYDQLDDALRRCGRIHRQFEFKDANSTIMENMFLSFYPEKVQNAKEFSTLLKKTRDVPVAAIQEFFIKRRKCSSEEAVKDVDTDEFANRRKMHEQFTN